VWWAADGKKEGREEGTVFAYGVATDGGDDRLADRGDFLPAL
jgi:hypothetical protein